MKLHAGIGGSWLLPQLLIVCVIGHALGQDVAGSAAVDASTIGNTAAINAVQRSVGAVEPLIDAGDLLKVSVFGVPEFDQEVRVSGSGTISLPLINEVHVAGLSTEQARELVQKRLIEGGFMRHPQVSVLEKEYATQGVSVLGEVMKPGVYPLLGSHRLFDLISMAGGTTPKAGTVVTVTHQGHPKEPVSINWSTDPSKSNEANVAIVPGDTIVVSKAGIVYVIGDVHRPAGFVMENGTELTVLRVIAMAEGPNPTAALNHAKLIRNTPKGPQEIPIQLKKIMSAAMPDMKLEADDIIFVPTSAAKSAAHRGLEGIIQAATAAAVYRPL
jgi:polysaccharide biosynthesis/export protein